MDTYENSTPREESRQPFQPEAAPRGPQPSRISWEPQPMRSPQGTWSPLNAQESEPMRAPQTSRPAYTPWEPQPYARRVSPYEDSPYMSYGSYQQAYAPRAPKKKKKVWKPLLTIFLVLCLTVSTCAITAGVVNAKWENRVETLEQQVEAKMTDLEKKVESAGTVTLMPGNTVEGLYTPSQVYAANVKSVVMISCKGNDPQSGVFTSSGSGFIITKDGYVVTNHHVVEDSTSVTVITTDGTEYPAKVVGADDVNDVALLKVDALNLSPVTLGSSAALSVGDQVAAIGNPLGELTSTLTVGYISAKERDVTTDGFAINMLQTDAAINSGNSGGPLFNMRGEVIGITTAKYSGTSSSGASIEGVGFAIPIDDVVDILEDLANYGYVTGGYLGVMVSDMDPNAANYYGMPMGAYVQEVTPGGAAQKAGLRAKDIIVELGGHEVRNVNSLTRALRYFKAGDETTIVVYRGGQKLTLVIVLDEKPAE